MGDFEEYNQGNAGGMYGITSKGQHGKPALPIEHLLTGNKRKGVTTTENMNHIQQLQHEKEIISWCVAEQQCNGGRLPLKVARTAMERLGIRSLETLRLRIQRARIAQQTHAK